MRETCCPVWNMYIDPILYAIHDYSYPQETSDYPYYFIFECGMWWP